MKPHFFYWNEVFVFLDEVLDTLFTPMRYVKITRTDEDVLFKNVN